VKKEENQRREQERLKLEKEKLRLQELELQQQEHELSKTIESKNFTKETVRNEDLNALIEKIYTEEADEPNYFGDLGENTSFGSASCKSLKSGSIVVTKTSPIVAAALSCQEEEDDFLLAEEKRNNSSISDKTKHKLIKQVHDSMDNLKNQLLNKGMCQYAADVESLNKNLETTAKKTR